MVKVKLFTHTDFDGVGCAVVAKLAYNNVDVEFCNYDNVDAKVEEYIYQQEYLKYDKTFITDLSINVDLAGFIDRELKGRFVLIDHHRTAEPLNKYDWCTVVVKDHKGACSGTSLFYDYAANTTLRKRNIKEFVEIVRQYDTWEWDTIYQDETPKQWNDLLYIYGRERFIDKVICVLLYTNKLALDETDLLLLDLDKEHKEVYFKEKESELSFMFNGEFKFGVVFAERYVSELGNYLAKQYPDLDFIALIGTKGISYRGIHDNIDLGEFAKQRGGGGHLKASGSPIDEGKQIKYIEDLFN